MVWRQPMRMGAALLCAMAALTLAPAVLAAPKSRFNRHIDTHKLDEQLKKGDRDDADWHEDTWDWKEKRKRRFDPDDPESLLRAARSGGQMEMLFVHFKDGTHTTDEETSQLSSQWAAMMRTGGVSAAAYPVKANQVMDFVQEQPETKKMTLKGQDYFPKKRLSKKARRKRRDRQRAAQRGEL
ncbi:unnamed protein product [Symbiodinium sp. KB8]|nr:unnamed protein product [Symbiodinium sp. KB8]